MTQQNRKELVEEILADIQISCGCNDCKSIVETLKQQLRDKYLIN